MAMVPCKECGKPISDKAAACPHCGKAPKRTSGCAWAAAILIGVPFGLIVLGQLMSIGRQASQTPEAAPQRTAVTSEQDKRDVQRRDAERQRAAEEAAKPVLKLVSFTCDRDSLGNSIIHGVVKNISSAQIDRAVEVHATFSTASGQSLGSDSGYVDYKPILVGQEVPFKFYGPTNPAYAKCSVDAMTTGFGTQLNWTK